MSIRILRMISKNHWSSLTFYARRHLRNSWPATTERWPHPHSRRPPSFCSTHVVSSNTSLVSKGEPNAKQSKKTPRICWLWWTRSGKNFYPTLALFIGQIGKNSYLSKRSPRTKGFSWRRKVSTFPCWQVLWCSPNAPVIVVCPPSMCSQEEWMEERLFSTAGCFIAYKVKKSIGRWRRTWKKSASNCQWVAVAEKVGDQPAEYSSRKLMAHKSCQGDS